MIALSVIMLNGFVMAQDSVKGAQYYKEAATFLEENNSKMAVITLEKAVQADSLLYDAHELLAKLYSIDGNFEKAKIYCYKALALKQDQREPHYFLATIYGQENKLDSSYAHFEAMTKLDPNDGQAYLGMAQIRTLQEDYDAALIYAKKAVELAESMQSPYTGNAQYLRGVLHYYLGQDKEAVKYLRVAAKNGVELEDHLLEYIMENEQKVINFESEADFKRTEKTLVKHYEFILNNPAEEGTTDRLNSCQYILDWVSTCPYITVQVTQKLVPYMTYGESLIVFMGGWANYCINGGDCSEKWKGCLAATRDVLDYYQANKEELGKNKDLEKMLRRNKKNKLEQYIRDNIK